MAVTACTPDVPGSEGDDPSASDASAPDPSDDGGDGPGAEAGEPTDEPPPAGRGPLPPDVEAPPTLWLCHPDLDEDPCRDAPATTAIDADGTRTEAVPTPAEDPQVDCFYVHPTVSLADTRNAPHEVTPEAVAIARSQAARFSEVCRVVAPVYRQVTLRGLVTGGYDEPAARDVAHADVVAAWEAHLAEAGDRPFVLVGHSQGAEELTRLLAEHIEPDPDVHDRLVLALLVGGQAEVPAGADVGGSLAETPACRDDGQVGCVVAYSSYTSPPGPLALFGRASRGREILCVNPASPAGGEAELTPYLAGSVLADVPTPSVTVAGAVTARCRAEGGASWLDVDLTGPLADAEPRLTGGLGAAWGLHLVEVELALGDLVDLVRDAAEARSG